MLFRTQFLEGIRAGTVTLAFRRWRRPSVRTGGTLLTAVGQIDITSVTPVSVSQISAADARRAGYESLDALRDELRSRVDGEIYRVELGELRADPRIALRKTQVETAAESRDLQKRLRRLDSLGLEGAWTVRTMEVIGAHPGVRAGDLCRMLGQEKARFKR